MVVVERMVGVTHQVHFTHRFRPQPIVVSLKPSEQLLSELDRLPKGTRVGIEEFSPEDRKRLDNIVVEGIEVTPHTGGDAYWNELKLQCEKNSLEVVYLDDPKPWKKYATEDVLRRLAQRRDGIKSWKDIFVHETRAEYAHVVRRELGFLDRIRKLQPTFVVLGRIHSDYFLSAPEQTEGVSFRSYAVEEGPPLDDVTRAVEEQLGYEIPGVPYRLDTDEYWRNRFVDNASVDLTFLADHRFVERKHRAVATRRITDKKPDFIGTWNLELPEKGIFELFIQERNGQTIKGIIEDLIGTSTFQGEFSNTHILFTKKYEGAIPHSVTAPVFWRYEGTNRGKKIVGEYSDPNHMFGSGKFEMKPFSFRATTPHN